MSKADDVNIMTSCPHCGHQTNEQELAVMKKTIKMDVFIEPAEFTIKCFSCGRRYVFVEISRE